MIKSALLVVAGFLALVPPLRAEPTRLSDGPSPRSQAGDSSFFSAAEVVPNQSRQQFASLTLEDGGPFSFSGAFGWMEATSPDFLPVFQPVEPRRARVARAKSTASPGAYSYGEIDEDYVNRVEVHGEVGFLYGRYTGKHGGDFKEGYVIGEVGNDKFHLTVGVYHGESSERVPHWGH